MRTFSVITAHTRGSSIPHREQMHRGACRHRISQTLWLALLLLALGCHSITYPAVSACPSLVTRCMLLPSLRGCFKGQIACRVLFEVASLERSEDTVQEACLRHLAASVRAAHKIHGFANGFDAELSALFDKVCPPASRVLFGLTMRLTATAETLCKAGAHAPHTALLL